MKKRSTSDTSESTPENQAPNRTLQASNKAIGGTLVLVIQRMAFDIDSLTRLRESLYPITKHDETEFTFSCRFGEVSSKLNTPEASFMDLLKHY